MYLEIGDSSVVATIFCGEEMCCLSIEGMEALTGIPYPKAYDVLEEVFPGTIPF